MDIDVFTLFPAAFDWFQRQHHVASALAGGHTISYVNYRDHTPLKAGQVDDTPFGGGAGMVLRVDVVEAAIRARYARDPMGLRRERTVIPLTPAGRLRAAAPPRSTGGGQRRRSSSTAPTPASASGGARRATPAPNGRKQSVRYHEPPAAGPGHLGPYLTRHRRAIAHGERSAFAMSTVIDSLESAQLRRTPAFGAGDRVRVHFQVVEGARRRTQVFEGVVIKRQGHGVRETFTVRKQSFGVGVERTFPVHSPKIERIEIAARGDVRRAKLYYLRGRVGKRARVRERRSIGPEEIVDRELLYTESPEAEVEESPEADVEEAPEAEVEESPE